VHFWCKSECLWGRNRVALKIVGQPVVMIGWCVQGACVAHQTLACSPARPYPDLHIRILDQGSRSIIKKLGPLYARARSEAPLLWCNR
jgi:hypothetical protein